MSTGTSSSEMSGRINGLEPSIPPRLLRAFRATDYEAAGVTARIGRRSAAMDRLLSALGARRGAFLTAWNPGARRRPLGQNQRWDHALRSWLRRVRAEPGFGSGRGWREAHWLIAADPRWIAVLGRRFRQVGIVSVARGQAARLHLLSAAARHQPTSLKPPSTRPAVRRPSRSTAPRPLRPGVSPGPHCRPAGPT